MASLLDCEQSSGDADYWMAFLLAELHSYYLCACVSWILTLPRVKLSMKTLRKSVAAMNLDGVVGFVFGGRCSPLF